MFELTDRCKYIKNLQKMLFVPLTGRINAQMRERIRELQKEHGYCVSGKVDYKTHLLIKKRYHETKSKQKLRKAIKPYDIGEDIVRINNELCLLIGLYGLNLRQPRGRALGFDGIKAVERLREIYCLPIGSEIDHELYDRMKRDILSMSANNKNGSVG